MKPFEERYIPEPNSGCWLWLESVAPDGYGRTRNGGKRKTLAHRLSWTLHRGEIPTDLCVLHKCDERSCVNPDHLFLGTYHDNAKDRDTKGRNGKQKMSGEKCYRARLTEADVKAIRLDTRPQRTVAKDYGITQSAISNIQLRKCWKHLA